jgi:phospholipid/cholesterol/gamma-HCH transport system permease protein
MNGDLPDKNANGQPPKISFDHREGGKLVVGLEGDWVLAVPRPAPGDATREIESRTAVTGVTVDGAALGVWDTGLLTFLIELDKYCRGRGIALDAIEVPDGARRLFDLATTVPEHVDSEPPATQPLLARVGDAALGLASGFGGMLVFVGDVTIALGRMFTGRARVRRRDVALFIQETGFEALPIVSLISFLVGVILAFIGAIQLSQFGAQIYVANLVGLAMTREMGAMMTAIIMAGRTGAAFAAQLGTMTVNEEVDAFRTAGVSPVEYLVLPRLIALAVMMPLLTLYADFVGIFGGMVVGVGMLDLSFAQYAEQSRAALGPMHFILGLIKASVYGVVVAFAGCYYGMRSGRSAAAVGSAVTSAVVMGILLIIVSSAITTILYNQLGI